MLRVSSDFAAALARTLAGLVLMLPCSPVVPGSERNQVSSVSLHRTYSIAGRGRGVKKQNFIVK